MVKQGTRGYQPLNMKRFKDVNWKTTLVAILVTLLAVWAWSAYLQTRTNEAKTRTKLEQQIKVNEQKQVELEKTGKSVEELKKQNEELNKQLQSKIKQKQAIAYAEAPPAQKPVTEPLRASQGVINCGDNPYKQFIYQKESGCNTGRWNSSGCFGIGQSCPASKIAHCGTNFACQDAWFTQYAISRYGSWQGAYNAWLRQHWW